MFGRDEKLWREVNGLDWRVYKLEQAMSANAAAVNTLQQTIKAMAEAADIELASVPAQPDRVVATKKQGGKKRQG